MSKNIWLVYVVDTIIRTSSKQSLWHLIIHVVLIHLPPQDFLNRTRGDTSLVLSCYCFTEIVDELNYIDRIVHHWPRSPPLGSEIGTKEIISHWACELLEFSTSNSTVRMMPSTPFPLPSVGRMCSSLSLSGALLCEVSVAEYWLLRPVKSGRLLCGKEPSWWPYLRDLEVPPDAERPKNRGKYRRTKGLMAVTQPPKIPRFNSMVHHIRASVVVPGFCISCLFLFVWTSDHYMSNQGLSEEYTEMIAEYSSQPQRWVPMLVLILRLFFGMEISLTNNPLLRWQPQQPSDPKAFVTGATMVWNWN